MAPGDHAGFEEVPHPRGVMYAAYPHAPDLYNLTHNITIK